MRRSITPGGNSISRPGSPSDDDAQTVGRRQFVGIDTLAVGFGVRWNRDTLAKLLERLEAGKAAAQESDDPAEAAIDLAGKKWTVRPAGWRLGAGKGPYIAYAFEREGVVFGLMRRELPLGQTPNVYVTVGSSACLAMGTLEGVIVELRRVLSELGASIEFEKVSRVDVFVDLEGVPVADVATAYIADRMICRARKDAAFGIHRNGRKKWSGIQVGRALMFRAYDKVEELKDQPSKRALWNALEWNDTAPRVVTRFEFEIKREKLAEFECRGTRKLGIDTLDELLANIGPIALYLCQRWIRFTRGDVDRTNTTRQAHAPFWERVIGAIQRWATNPEPATRNHRPRLADVEGLIRQARGCIESAAALLHRPRGVRSLLDLCTFARELLADQDKRDREGATPHIYEEAIAGKRLLYGARQPIGPRSVGVWT